ncbi:MAG: chorismate synthase [Comamonadaceae bacterium]|nr:chorismate synthase [Comamonadaceae bacterium]
MRLDEVDRNPFFCPDPAQVPELEALHGPAAQVDGDSIGARVDGRGERRAARAGASRCSTGSTPTSRYAMMGINAVKGVEIGAGFGVRGAARHRAPRRADAGGLPRATTPAACSAASPPGQDIVVSIALKPTSSIRLPRPHHRRARRSRSR